MADLKILNFSPKKHEETPEELPCQMPSEEVINDLLNYRKLDGVFVLIINEDGVLSHYTDNLSSFELVGMLEAAKLDIISNNSLED